MSTRDQADLETLRWLLLGGLAATTVVALLAALSWFLDHATTIHHFLIYLHLAKGSSK